MICQEVAGVVRIRFGQDCETRYGQSLGAFRIVELSPEVYREEPLAKNPILQAGEANWNRAGMHHCDILPVDGTWRAITDGHSKRWILNPRLFTRY